MELNFSKSKYDGPELEGYKSQVDEDDLEHEVAQIAYLELGDEILDMYAVREKLEPYMLVQAYEGWHHRLASPENLNSLIQHMQIHFLNK